MSLLEQWRQAAYENQTDQASYDRFWNAYFVKEKAVYEQILPAEEPVKGTVAALAEKFDMTIMEMTGFLDGINDSLTVPNPIEEMTEDTEVSLEFDKEKLYYNMVACKADWLYELPQWDGLLTEDRRKELYEEQKNSGTVRRETKKIGRNDPCPCGSGKKYKHCCGRGK